MKSLNLRREISPIIKPISIIKERSNKKYQELFEFLNRHKKKENQILLSIILPVYNEERIICTVLENLPKNKNIEIIVIDDHSTDNSINKIKKLQKKYEIRVYKHKRNTGYGGAIKTGVMAAKGDIIITMDSDGQHNPLDIFSLIRPIFDGEADMTIGSRYLGANYYNLPLITRLGEAVMEKLIQVFFQLKVMNNQNGFRAFNKKIIPLFDTTKYQDYTTATEIILKTALKGYQIKECPIKLYHRQFGSSGIGLTKLTLNLFSCIFQYFLKKIKIFLLHRKNGNSL